MGKAQYDKYEPYANGFRALLNADFTDPAKFGVPLGVGLNANGRLVVGTSQTGVVGLLVLSMKRKAGKVVDTMTSGEITGLTGLTAGTVYYADAATGALTTTATNNKKVGFTVEADRLIVRTVW